MIRPRTPEYNDTDSKFVPFQVFRLIPNMFLEILIKGKQELGNNQAITSQATVKTKSYLVKLKH